MKNAKQTTNAKTYKMMRENEKLDLYGWMLDELLINLGKIKGEKKGTFRYGNLIVHLILFFMNETPIFGKRRWAFDIPVWRQLKQSIATLLKITQLTYASW